MLEQGRLIPLEAIDTEALRGCLTGPGTLSSRQLLRHALTDSANRDPEHPDNVWDLSHISGRGGSFQDV